VESLCLLPKSPYSHGRKVLQKTSNSNNLATTKWTQVPQYNWQFCQSSMQDPVSICLDPFFWTHFFKAATSCLRASYYINTSENFIPSHVKITCYLHTWRDHRRYGYIINRAFESKLIWYFTGVYIINRILHTRPWIWISSSRVQPDISLVRCAHLWDIELTTRR